nr:hypothetical protein [Frondihabitans sp. PhB188]
MHLQPLGVDRRHEPAQDPRGVALDDRAAPEDPQHPPLTFDEHASRDEVVAHRVAHDIGVDEGEPADDRVRTRIGHDEAELPVDGRIADGPLVEHDDAVARDAGDAVPRRVNAPVTAEKRGRDATLPDCEAHTCRSTGIPLAKGTS